MRRRERAPQPAGPESAAHFAPSKRRLLAPARTTSAPGNHSRNRSPKPGAPPHFGRVARARWRADVPTDAYGKLRLALIPVEGCCRERARSLGIAHGKAQLSERQDLILIEVVDDRLCRAHPSATGPQCTCSPCRIRQLPEHGHVRHRREDRNNMSPHPDASDQRKRSARHAAACFRTSGSAAKAPVAGRLIARAFALPQMSLRAPDKSRPILRVSTAIADRWRGPAPQT